VIWAILAGTYVILWLSTARAYFARESTREWWNDYCKHCERTRGGSYIGFKSETARREQAAFGLWVGFWWFLTIPWFIIMKPTKSEKLENKKKLLDKQESDIKSLAKEYGLEIPTTRSIHQ